LRQRVSGSSAEIFSGLDLIIKRLDDPVYENIDAVVSVSKKDVAGGKGRSKTSADVKAEASVETAKVSAKLSGGIGAEMESSLETIEEQVYTEILMRVIGVNEIIGEIKQLLNSIGVRNLYIFLDDFSELPNDAMELLVDVLISPLARWSEFIKFKIAAYPGRVYLGSLDKTKIEEINLDMFGLYSGGGITRMEEKAIDFVKRVIDKRISHFCKCDPSVYFDKNPDLYRVMFYASMANPRILGICFYTPMKAI
jgi:hypothetical protein